MSGPDRPTVEAREAVNRLLRCNRRTEGAEVGEMFLGRDIVEAYDGAVDYRASAGGS